MELKVEVNGWCGQVVAGVVPKILIEKIAEYCTKKAEDINNVVYNDHILATIGNDVGLEGLVWHELPGKFYHNNGHWWKPKPNYLAIVLDGKEWGKLGPEDVGLETNIVHHPNIAEPEALLITGITSKGSIIYTFKKFKGDFDPQKLTIYLDKIADFYKDERLSSKLTYDGVAYDTYIEKSIIKYWYDPIVYINTKTADLLTDYIYS